MSVHPSNPNQRCALRAGTPLRALFQVPTAWLLKCCWQRRTRLVASRRYSHGCMDCTRQPPCFCNTSCRPPSRRPPAAFTRGAGSHTRSWGQWDTGRHWRRRCSGRREPTAPPPEAPTFTNSVYRRNHDNALPLYSRPLGRRTYRNVSSFTFRPRSSGPTVATFGEVERVRWSTAVGDNHLRAPRAGTQHPSPCSGGSLSLKPQSKALCAKDLSSWCRSNVPSISRKVSREVEVEGPGGSADCVSMMRHPAFVLGFLASFSGGRLAHLATTATGSVISLQCRGTEPKVPFKYVTASQVYPARTVSRQRDPHRSVMSSLGAGGGWLCPACTLLCNIGRDALQTALRCSTFCVSGTCKPTIPSSRVRHPGRAPTYNWSYIQQPLQSLQLLDHFHNEHLHLLVLVTISEHRSSTCRVLVTQLARDSPWSECVTPWSK
jgi:hypothetical protein